ncbi:putative ubiquitination network signaling protein acrB [Pseudocercospora fuligena]|uniref:Putative ubiquitination network signaling protein acrB n=1 Tax=Pseudocercospora fuligena TaxID=685502 RepID=A0A8H6RFD9_9PEZI|nr:putative ubiquitination network signaling protein acrB [Pseudocercospora fuligena]
MPTKKPKNESRQHDNTNSKGLAPPGKRVVRQRSNGQLNGQPNGKSTTAVTPPALPSTGLNQGFKFPRSADTTAPGTAAATATVKDHAAASAGAERERTASDASAEEVGPHGEMADSAHELNVGTPSLEVPSSAACKTSTHAPGSLFSVSTILAYYPLRDAISILILLLSLPPTLVLFIQTLFASLTFVPPTAGLSLSTLPNVKEMFNSSNFGYPAMATILFVDCFFGLVWLPLWKPAQAIFLDLSQAVIAVSLSGAAASTGGPTHSIATCTILVCIVHVLRYRAIHLTALDYLRSVLHKLDIGIALDAPVFAQSSYSFQNTERGMFFNAARVLLGIHIVSQGVTTCIRRTLANAKASEKDLNVPAITKTDTEAIAGAEPTTRTGSGIVEGSQPSHAYASTDGRPPGQPPSHRESKQRESSSKKKRKQANQVRSQQPLWAAVASTKVTFVKEMEQRDAADDARDAAIMNNNTSNTFASVTNTTNRIWICEVRDTEILFTIELCPEAAAELADDKDESPSLTTAIDRSKPFYIRVNGAAWSSTRILEADDEEKGGLRYDGEIFGLAPLSSYHCEVVSMASQRIICSVSLITQPAPSAEQAAAVPAQPQHQALRPSSPITTLKQSIQSAEAKLNEARNRSKRTKRDQRAAHADIRKEINSLRSKLESSTGADDKQDRRLNQIKQHKNQAEEATRDYQAQIEALGEIPADELAESQVERRAYQSASDAVKAAQRELDNARAEQEREKDALKSDLAAVRTKKEKLSARIAQRAQELEEAKSQHAADLTARQRRDFERARELQDRENAENGLKFHIAAMEQEQATFAQKTQEAYHQALALSNWSAPPGYPGYSSPPTPENANGQVSPQANGFPPTTTFGPQHFSSPFNPAAIPHGTQAPRGRSSSMLSQYSGFTDNAEDYPQSQHHQTWPMSGPTTAGAALEDRNNSDGGSGSGSGSASLVNGATLLTENGSNSPRPEAKPFIPGAPSNNVNNVGTIGPPGGKKVPQSPTQTSGAMNGR